MIQAKDLWKHMVPISERSMNTYWLPFKEIITGSTKLWYHSNKTDRFNLQYTWF